MSFEEDEQFSSVKKNKPFKETDLEDLSVEEIKEYVEHSKKEILDITSFSFICFRQNYKLEKHIFCE